MESIPAERFQQFFAIGQQVVTEFLQKHPELLPATPTCSHMSLCVTLDTHLWYIQDDAAFREQVHCYCWQKMSLLAARLVEHPASWEKEKYVLLAVHTCALNLLLLWATVWSA